MRIGVVSDTHGDEFAIAEVLKAAGKVDAWIHLGDNLRDAPDFSKNGAQVYSVSGNCDFFGDTEQIIQLDGIKIFACHGHTYGVDSGTARLSYRAQELGCTVALYGHTHVPDIDEYPDMLMLNPGSPTKPRRGAPYTFAMLTTDGKGWVDSEIIRIF